MRTDELPKGWHERRELNLPALSPAPGSWPHPRQRKPTADTVALCLADDFSKHHYQNARTGEPVVELISRYSMSEQVKSIWSAEFLKLLRENCCMPMYTMFPKHMYVAELETSLVCDVDDEIVIQIRALLKERPDKDTR